MIGAPSSLLVFIQITEYMLYQSHALTCSENMSMRERCFKNSSFTDDEGLRGRRALGVTFYSLLVLASMPYNNFRSTTRTYVTNAKLVLVIHVKHLVFKSPRLGFYSTTGKRRIRGSYSRTLLPMTVIFYSIFLFTATLTKKVVLVPYCTGYLHNVEEEKGGKGLIAFTGSRIPISS